MSKFILHADVRTGDFSRSFPSFPGSAAYWKVHSPVVWGRTGRLDNLSPFFPVAPPRGLRLCAPDFPLSLSPKAGRIAFASSCRRARFTSHHSARLLETP